MKTLLLVFLAPGLAWASTSIFDFTDLRGYEKCLRQDFIVEAAKGSAIVQHRGVDHFEIQTRCIHRAVKLLSAKKDPKAIMEYIKSTKQNSNAMNAIDLVQLLVDTNRPSCNGMEAYTVITKCLSGSKDKGRDSYFERTKRVVKACLKDAEFRKDFIEEKNSPDSYLSTNACELLIGENVMKECKKKGKG